MSPPTTANLSVSADVFDGAVRAAAAFLPADMGWNFELLDQPILPGSARAASVDLGPSGRVVIAVAPTLGRALQLGPPPAEDLLDGLAPVFDQFVRALQETVDASLSASAPQDVDPVAALTAGAGGQALTVKLTDGERHNATICLMTGEATSSAMTLAPHEFDAIPEITPGGVGSHSVTVLHEVEMGVTVELGRTRMVVRDILSLSIGSVIELDRAAGSPVDVMVNGTLIARGEVVVIDEEFGIRISEVVGYQADSGRNRR